MPDPISVQLYHKLSELKDLCLLNELTDSETNYLIRFIDAFIQTRKPKDDNTKEG